MSTFVILLVSACIVISHVNTIVLNASIFMYFEQGILKKNSGARTYTTGNEVAPKGHYCHGSRGGFHKE